MEYVTLGVKIRGFNSNLFVVMKDLFNGRHRDKDLKKVQKQVRQLTKERGFQSQRHQAPHPEAEACQV